MKNTGITILIIIAALASAYAIFSSQETTVDDDGRIRAPENVTLGVGDTGEAAGVTITFNELVQDNRCPIDVVCIEGGAVTVNITLASGDETTTLNKASDEAPLVFAGYEVSIVGVAPEAVSTRTIDKDEYEITFHVAPVASGESEGAI